LGGGYKIAGNGRLLRASYCVESAKRNVRWVGVREDLRYRGAFKAQKQQPSSARCYLRCYPCAKIDPLPANKKSPHRLM
jgi:hypothetical protein